MTDTDVELDPLRASVSVVIPVYNGRAFVCDAIDSALQQQGDYLNEVLVIDDGSSDGTAELVQERYPDRVRLITKPHNQGASAARNTGIFAAAADYVAFLDADDIWTSDKLAQQMPVFAEKQAGMVCSAGKVIDIDTSQLLNADRYRREGGVKPLSLTYLFEHPLIYTTSLVLPTELARRLNGFDTQYKTAEDIDFVLRVAAASSVYLCAQPLVEYRRRANSLGSCPNSYHDHLRVLDAFLAKHPQFSQQHPQLVKRTQRRIYDKWLEDSLYQRQFATFFTTLWRSTRLSWSLTTSKLALKSLPLLLLSALQKG